MKVKEDEILQRQRAAAPARRDGLIVKVSGLQPGVKGQERLGKRRADASQGHADGLPLTP